MLSNIRREVVPAIRMFNYESMAGKFALDFRHASVNAHDVEIRVMQGSINEDSTRCDCRENIVKVERQFLWRIMIDTRD